MVSGIGTVHTNRPQPGQPAPYFAWIAAVRSTPATLAMVASHASTSANSADRSFVRALAQHGRQFAHLLHQPHEGAVDAAGNVLLDVHAADQLLQLGQRDVRPGGGRGRRSGAGAIETFHGQGGSFQVTMYSSHSARGPYNR